MLHDQHSAELPCPCGSGRPFLHCCEPAIEGAVPAATAEALMRSRYTAFVLERTDYLVMSTHPDHRTGLDAEEIRQQTATTTWLGLHIDHTRGGAIQDDSGEVLFHADFFADGRLAALSERSRFRREGGLWYYCDGEIDLVESRIELGPGDPCPCGSGREFDHCCGE
jgi:SEC-C motif-containing protein